MSDLLPKNSTQLEKRIAEAVSLHGVDAPIGTVWSPDVCAAELLPWLAWALSVDEWDLTWTERQKRDAIKASCSVHQHKGTIGAVIDALGSLGFAVRVQEWFSQSPAGQPYTFKLLIDVDQVGYDINGLKKLERVVSASKNLRSHIASIGVSVATSATEIIAAVSGTGNEIVVGYSAATYPDGAAAIDLMTDAAFAGEESTISAIDSLHELLNSTMPIAYGW